eukprot:1466706-Amphidinium_carterae.1
MIIGAWTAFPLKAFLDVESMSSAAKARCHHQLAESSEPTSYHHRACNRSSSEQNDEGTQIT